MDNNTPKGAGYNDGRNGIDRSSSGLMSWEERQEYDRGQALARDEKARDAYYKSLFDKKT